MTIVCVFVLPVQWDVLAVSCYGPLDGGLSALQEQMVADQAEAAEKAAVGGGGGRGGGGGGEMPATPATSAVLVDKTAVATAGRGGGGSGGASQQDGLVLLEGGSQLGQLLLGIVRGVLFEVRRVSSVSGVDCTCLLPHTTTRSGTIGIAYSQSAENIQKHAARPLLSRLHSLPPAWTSPAAPICHAPPPSWPEHRRVTAGRSHPPQPL